MNLNKKDINKNCLSHKDILSDVFKKFEKIKC